MAKGWIKLHREVMDNSIWTDSEPFDKRSAWIDLLLMANYKDFEAIKGMTLVSRKRGEVNTSVLFLAKRWGWSRNRVYRFLALLKSDGMVSVDGTPDGTTVTIENYEKYQIPQTADETTNGTTDETTTDTTNGTTNGTTSGTHDKNIKEYIKNGEECKKNGERRERGRFTPPTLPEVEAYIREKGYHFKAQSFISFYESKGWMVGKNKMKSWKGAAGTWESRWQEEHPEKPKSKFAEEADELLSDIFGSNVLGDDKTSAEEPTTLPW